MAVQEVGLEGLEAVAGVRLLRPSVVVVAAEGVVAGEAATVDSVVEGEAALRVVVEVVDVVAIAPWTIRSVRAMEAAACSIRRADIGFTFYIANPLVSSTPRHVSMWGCNSLGSAAAVDCRGSRSLVTWLPTISHSPMRS